MIDHLVYATPDLAATVDRLGASLGSALSPGGQHVGLGTRNFLAGLGDGGYLEVIGPDPEQPDPPAPRPFGIDALSEAQLVTWALGTTDIEATIERARRAGYDPGPAIGMSRRRPDGVLLEWRLTLQPDGLVPFLIDWGGSDHPSRSVARGAELITFRGSHPDPDAVRRRLAALGAELDVQPGPEPALEAVLSGPRGLVTLR